MSENSEPVITSASGVVISEYLAIYEPAASMADGADLKTTDDIIGELAAMVDLERDQVVCRMLAAGFHTYHDHDGRHGWCMKRK